MTLDRYSIRKPLRPAAPWLLALTVGILSCGCTSPLTVGPLKKGTGVFFFTKPKPARNLAQIVCLWQPAQGRGVDNLPSRGFSGQILFMAHNQSTPVPVRGDVRIYVFDSYATAEQSGKPVHQYDFPVDVWDLHRRESKIGTVYHVFIPYGRRGIHRADCALSLRFEPEDGPPIFSELVRVKLPGPDAVPPSLKIETEEIVPSSETIELSPKLGSIPASDTGVRAQLQTFAVPSRTRFGEEVIGKGLRDAVPRPEPAAPMETSGEEETALDASVDELQPSSFKLRLRPANLTQSE